MATTRLDLSRQQILAFRRRVNELDARLPEGADSIRRAAWAGLQDSMPRAALLSVHARIERAHPETWADPALVQVWGPRFSVYAVPQQDHALFTVARYPDDARGRRVAEDMAARLAGVLGTSRMADRDAMERLGVGNGIRYATTTGTILVRWEGARAPMIWTVPRPEIDPSDARLELARRYLHVFGPTTAEKFAEWAGIGAAPGQAAFDGLADELTPVRTPIGDRWILSSDEPNVGGPPRSPALARLLPSGDAYYLSWGVDRELLVPDARRRAELWTSRVWPGAVLVGGDIVGTWRRANHKLDIQPWRRLTRGEREAVETEASSLPLPALPGPIQLRWED
jgi:Winged helix DNA-binding domain